MSLHSAQGVLRVEVVGAGYLIFYLDIDFLVNSLTEPQATTPQLGEGHRRPHIGQHKTATHIGHLPNAALGDVTVRLLRAAGERVEVQNYIDNTGVQVADAVVGFKHIEHKTLDQIKAIEFNDHLWLNCASSKLAKAKLRDGRLHLPPRSRLPS